MSGATLVASYRTVRDGNDLRVVFDRFPWGLERFGHMDALPLIGERGDRISSRFRVVILCRGTDGTDAEKAGYDLTPILTAADWLRDQGFVVRCGDPSEPAKPLPHDPV